MGLLEKLHLVEKVQIPKYRASAEDLADLQARRAGDVAPPTSRQQELLAHYRVGAPVMRRVTGEIPTVDVDTYVKPSQELTNHEAAVDAANSLSGSGGDSDQSVTNELPNE